MLFVALVLGIALGGAFVGGIVLGKSQNGDSQQADGPARLGPRAGGQSGGPVGDDGASASRQGFRQSPPSTNGANAARPGPGAPRSLPPSQILGTPAGGQARPGAGDPERDRRSGPEGRGRTGRGFIGGTIESVDAESITIATPRGAVTANLFPSSRIVKFHEAPREELAPGIQVRVAGPRDSEGTVQADSIMIVTEDDQEFFGSRPGPRGP